ncbi:MAG: DUF190 domain-containing protein [Pseudomonadota bacterium]
MHTRKRIELIIERMAYKRACRILEAVGIKGYTVTSAMAGYGNGTRWASDTDISDSNEMVVMIAIADEETITECLEQLSSLLGAHIGVVSTCDVQVLRPELF